MFDELFNEVSDESHRSGGKYDSMLSSDVRTVLDEFQVWLIRAEGKSVATSQSYRSYVAKAKALGLKNDDMTSDIRSGVRALKRFMAQR